MGSNKAGDACVFSHDKFHGLKAPESVEAHECFVSVLKATAPPLDERLRETKKWTKHFRDDGQSRIHKSKRQVSKRGGWVHGAALAPSLRCSAPSKPSGMATQRSHRTRSNTS